MKKVGLQFRRSHKSSDKGDPSSRISPSLASIPQKDAVAILPPKKVIKAMYPFDNPNNEPGFLTFERGDFLHVVAREDDPDWYEACNPLKKTRGLVPVNYFTLVDKRVVRDSNTDTSHIPLGSVQSAISTHPQPFSIQNQPISAPVAAARSTGTTGGSPIYGVVLYDFEPERPDELQATQGDFIIVIAQSNPEWFVAKPITKLGGPGLVPVSFIEIRDTVSGKPVDDPVAAIKRAGVPTVEEWKRMAAEYKNSSISLGRITSNSSSSHQLNSSMDRLSMNSRQDGNFDNGGLQRNGTPYSQGRNAGPQSQQQSMALTSPTRARVSGYFSKAGDFYFNVEALMEDGKAWNLERTYKDFYGLQLHLIEQFPEEAGRREGTPRTLPKMPGPLPFISEKLTAERCRYLDAYLRQLLRINQNINNSHVVRGFFYPREEDVQVTPSDDILHGDRFSDASHGSPHGESQESLTGPMNVNGQDGQQRPPPQNHSQQPSHQQHQQQQQQQQPFRSNSPQHQKSASNNHYRSPSELRGMNGSPNGAPPPMLRNDSAVTSVSGFSGTSSQQYVPGPNGQVPAVTEKIKVWFGESNCVVIRLPSTFNYADLVMKLRERWSLEPGCEKANVQDVGFDIEYKDEQTQGYYRILSDDELAIARDRNEKLTLRVSAVSSMM